MLNKLFRLSLGRNLIFYTNSAETTPQVSGRCILAFILSPMTDSRMKYFVIARNPSEEISYKLLSREADFFIFFSVKSMEVKFIKKDLLQKYLFCLHILRFYRTADFNCLYHRFSYIIWLRRPSDQWGCHRWLQGLQLVPAARTVSPFIMAIPFYHPPRVEWASSGNTRVHFLEIFVSPDVVPAVTLAPFITVITFNEIITRQTTVAGVVGRVILFPHQAIRK